MRLPDKINRALQGDTALIALVNGAISASQNIISNKPEFFPEYTDHGPDHNTEVLDTALGILTEETLEILSNQDFAVLVLSVLLHDCGMHLSGDSFVALIASDNNLTTRLDQKTWAELWKNFLLEAKRFDGKQNRRTFGSPNPITEPPADPADYTLKHRLLIGEFLRRHHPRLAHEISIFGFPAHDGTRIKLLQNESGDLSEVAGLVARSHGMSLRQACDYFATHFHEREYQGVHPPIIMAALRIADYLQIQPDRAPESTLKLHKIRSPFSRGEWRVHQSVRNITQADNDPEAIYVDAQPSEVETYLKFKSWVFSFQSELDSTWAALGEVYGRYSDQGFDKFALRLRRLRTSIDDITKFSQTSEYVPAKIAFEASSADLLSLLVAPLYGDRPEIGLRELIQNSVDAVRERTHIEGQSPRQKLNGYDTDVIVYPIFKDDELMSVVVEDRGIGMDVDVLRNYFLRAGASFRNSAEWKKEFTSDEGESKIARTGRFGIGALAGFLLGNTIRVETRRLGEDKGLLFDAELDRDAIEVRYSDMDIGTKITVTISDLKRVKVTRLFSNQSYLWDWYCLASPKLVRLNKNMEVIEPLFSYVNDAKWVNVATENTTNLKWSHKKLNTKNSYRSQENALYVNGIFVQNLQDYGNEAKIIGERRISKGIKISSPTVLATDNDGNMKINLQRNALTETDKSISEVLRISMSEDLIAQALAFAPEETPFNKGGNEKTFGKEISADFSMTSMERDTYRNTDLRSQWCWEDHGWKLADPILSTRKSNLLAIYSDFDLSFLSKQEHKLSDTSLVWVKNRVSNKNISDLREGLRHFTRSGYFFGRSRDIPKDNAYPVAFELVVSEMAYKKLLNANVPKYLNPLLDSANELSNGFVALTTDDFEHPLSGEIAANFSGNELEGFAYAIVGGTNRFEANDKDIFFKLWMDLVGDSIIPLKFSERVNAFPRAFDMLGERINYYREQLD